MGKDIDAEHLCDVIKNLRLFTNTNKEWKEKYGSLYKPGQKEKLLDVLNAQCKKEYDEDFDPTNSWKNTVYHVKTNSWTSTNAM
jgi:hypothetical protein